MLWHVAWNCNGTPLKHLPKNRLIILHTEKYLLKNKAKWKYVLKKKAGRIHHEQYKEKKVFNQRKITSNGN